MTIVVTGGVGVAEFVSDNCDYCWYGCSGVCQ